MGAIKNFPKIFYKKISLPAEKLFISNFPKLITSNIILLILFANLLILTACEDEVIQPPPKPPGYQEDIPWPSLADSPWPMGNHDPQNTGRSKYSGLTNGQVVDSISAYNLQAGCVVGPDSTIYFISSNLAVLNAVTLNGNIKWQRTIAVESVTTPLIDKNNRIYAAGGKSLFCFTSTGDSVWEFRCDGRYFVSYNLNIDKNGNLYIIDDTHSLYSISPTGTLNWKFTDTRIPANSFHSPAFSPDGNTIYIQGDQVSLIALDINSVSIKWVFGNVTSYSGPVVDCQGNIYLLPGERVTSNSGPYTFYCINSDGVVKWNYTITDEYLGLFDTPTIDRLGNIYFGNDSLYSFSYSGNLNWKKFIAEAAIKTSIICDGNNNIYFGTVDNTFYAFGQDSVLKFTISLNIMRSLLQPMIPFDGMILLSTYRDNRIFLIN
jgi:hypothetical protein